MFLTQFNHFPLKPMLLITAKIASCSIVSKALAKSNLRIIIVFLEA
jgi:hypothetical protein